MAKRVSPKKSKPQGTLFDKAAREGRTLSATPASKSDGSNGMDGQSAQVDGGEASARPKGRGRKRTNGSSNGANRGFEARLWEAADKLRNNMDAIGMLPNPDCSLRAMIDHHTPKVWTEELRGRTFRDNEPQVGGCVLPRAGGQRRAEQLRARIGRFVRKN